MSEASSENKPEEGEPAKPTPRSRRPPSWAGIDPTTLRQLSGIVDWQDKMGLQISQLAASAQLFESIERARLAAIPRFELPSLRLAEQMSSLITGPSPLTGTLAAQLADARLSVLGSAPTELFAAASKAELLRLTEVSRLLEHKSALLAAMLPVIEVSRPVVFATQAWESVTNITTVLDDARLARLQMTSRGTSGAIEAGLILTEPDEESVQRQRAELSTTRGPAEASTLLRGRLVDVHPDLLNRLDGAWERITGGGSDAASQAANSLMEAVDWTLRLLSPDDEVLTWHAAEGRNTSELHNGKPTRTLRIRYAVRLHPEKRKATELYVKSVQEMVTVIQSPKHSIETRSVEALAPIALTVEGLLYFLIVD